MNICYATSECVPYVKTGGLGDVAGALPRFLSDLGCDVKVFLPLYASIHASGHDLTLSEELTGLSTRVGDRNEYFSVWTGRLPDSDVETYLIECPRYFNRSSVYTDDPDEFERFILFQRAILGVMRRIGWSPDILHANDWQTSLLPVYLKEDYSRDVLFRNTLSLLSIHNIGYQGAFDRDTVRTAGLSERYTGPGEPFEYHGRFSFLKAGLCFADAVSTVSPTYAEEILTPAFGEGLDGVLGARDERIVGILNGIDTGTWNPATDSLIAALYDANSLDKKLENKIALQNRFGLSSEPELPLLGVVSRFAHQKGFELLFPILGGLLESGRLRLAVLGSGDSRTELFFSQEASRFPDRLGAHIGYDEGLAHQIEAGADLFLMPSLYEPCGLNQMYSLRYGTLPIVRNTGGLADTVTDVDADPKKGNGFIFDDPSSDALLATIQRAVDAFGDRTTWHACQVRAMALDFSWDAAARAYLELYESL